MLGTDKARTTPYKKYTFFVKCNILISHIYDHPFLFLFTAPLPRQKNTKSSFYTSSHAVTDGTNNSCRMAARCVGF